MHNYYFNIYLIFFSVYESCGNDNPCLNGGTCLSHLFQHICSCMAGTSGRYCETSKHYEYVIPY